MMPCQSFGLCFFACPVLKKFTDVEWCATLILLAISDLGIFRVVKTATLISVKQLIHSNLQVALQNAETLTFCFHVNLFLTFPWAKVRNR